MSSGITAERVFYREEAASALLSAPLRLLHALTAAPVFIFLVTLTAMLFRPPDLKSLPWDRIAFPFLISVIGIHFCIQRERLRTYPVTWPLLGLTLLGLCSVLSQRYEAQAWSLLVAKWIVPFTLFHIAGLVFRDQSSLHKLEVFCLAVLTYLSTMSVLFFLDARSFIFPRFILDEGIGIHADRARGPFLQAVANGVSLNILGLIVLDSFRRKRLPRVLAILLLAGVPLAFIATKTRAVWISAALSLVFLSILPSSKRVRRAALELCVIAAIGAITLVFYQFNSSTLSDRLADRSPVEFRLGMYRAGWEMFTQKPFIGWKTDAQMQAELARRASDFRPDYYVFHNTYLELAVKHGLLGLGLYAWLVVSLFRLRNVPKTTYDDAATFSDSGFRQLWPVILAAYLLNASAVVMNYQFVNGLLFTFAGILAARERDAFAGGGG